jgi:hypothetical protein
MQFVGEYVPKRLEELTKREYFWMSLNAGWQMPTFFATVPRRYPSAWRTWKSNPANV